MASARNVWILLGAAMTLYGIAEAKVSPQHPSGVVIVAPDEIEDSIVLGSERISLETGVPLALYDPRTPVPHGAPEEMARTFLGDRAERFGLADAALGDLEHHHTRESDVGYTVRFRQRHRGLPVHDSGIAVTINRDDTVVYVVNGYKPALDLVTTTPAIAADVARSIALEHLGVRGPIGFEAVDLVIYHVEGRSHLAHRVVVVPGESPIGEWQVMIDAFTGEILKAVDVSHYVDGTGNLFDPDPLSSAGATYGDPGYTDAGDADSPELVAEIVSYTLPDITYNGLVYSLVGPWAEIRDTEAPFEGLYNQPTSDWNFTRSPQEFEAALCYWHIDNYMRYINLTLGVPVTPFQYTGGARFDPHALNGADNSHYTGATGVVAFGDGGVDDSEDADVVLHELGHAIHDWLTVGGLSQVNGLSEGFGDYVAASYSRSLGQWDPSDPQHQWVFSWDGHNQFWGGRRTDYGATYPDGLVGQIHTDGQIFSTCMMRIWDRIGREQTDKATFEGLAMTGSSTSQQGAAQAIMQAAINLDYSEVDLNAMYEEFTTTGYVVDPPVAVAETGLALDATRMLTSHPNPFNPRTTIEYAVPAAGAVTLAIYDPAGRLVHELVRSTLEAGRHTVTWDGRAASGAEVASGVYTLRLTAGGLTESRRLVLLK